MLDEHMIPLLPSPRRLSPTAVPPQRMGPAAVLLIVASVLTWAACDKVPLTAPTGSTITLFVNPAVILTNGTADVTAVVLESSGTPVQNGTLVSFYSNIGAIDPAEAQTLNGRVSVKFRAGQQSGDAQITAMCGAATLAGTATVTVATEVAATISTVVLSATPATIPPAGASVQLLAFVTDANGSPVFGVPVAFTATAGTLSVPIVASDSSGMAQTTLTTSVQTTVTATAGGKTANVTISVLPTLSVTVAATPASAIVNAGVTFTATVSASGGGTVPAISDYRWTFGDGSTATTTGPQTSHIYTSTGTKVVTVTVTASNGSSGTGRLELAVN